MDGTAGQNFLKPSMRCLFETMKTMVWSTNMVGGERYLLRFHKDWRVNITLCYSIVELETS